MIILRRELESFVRNYGWGLLYGRRKTGKTFYMRERGRYDHYFVASRTGTVRELRENETFTKTEFLKLFPRILGESVVVDEFHRLGEEFFTLLQGLAGEGRLMIITSTLHLAKKLLSSGSPLLGLFEEKKVGLISPLDLLRTGLQMEEAVLYQEPSLVGRALPTKNFVRGIVGEIFNEEERRLTKVYEGILSAVASGKNKSGEISSYLFSHGLLEKDDPSLIQTHLYYLTEMGFLEKVEVLSKKKRFYYRHVSPALEFGFYLAEKYGWFDIDLPQSFIERVWRERFPFFVERFAERYFSELLGFRPVKILKPEVDIALVRFKKLVFLGEVKWKERVTRKEVREVEVKFGEVESKFGEVERKVLVVPEAGGVPETELEVWDVERMRREAKRL